MALIGGILLGVVVYSLTVFPIALAFDPSGDVWLGATTLYGVVCGFLGVAFMAARDI